MFVWYPVFGPFFSTEWICATILEGSTPITHSTVTDPNSLRDGGICPAFPAKTDSLLSQLLQDFLLRSICICFSHTLCIAHFRKKVYYIDAGLIVRDVVESIYILLLANSTKIAFCPCNRFSAWSISTDWEESISSSENSSPWCTGMGCISMASDLAIARSLGVI